MIDPARVPLPISRFLIGHPRLVVRAADGLELARDKARVDGELYCGVVLDLTDLPLDASRESGVRDLYAQAVAAIAPIVRPGGWVAAQAGTPEVQRPHAHLPSLLRELFLPHFTDAEQRDVPIPSDGEPNSFLLAAKP